jgi:poly(hydroxyalkanoate) depolymerase family esterase
VIKLFLTFFSLLLFVLNGQALAGRIEKGTYFSLWGFREYKVFLPSNHNEVISHRKMPVITALHGCMQDAESFAGGTRLNEWAEKLGFAVYYPEQSKVFNIYNCWNWFLPINQTRNLGEAELIMGGLKKVSKKFSLNTKKTFLMGMSAGGAVVSILANSYPEKFKAIGAHHGTMYKAATDSSTAKDVVYNGSKVSPEVAAAKGFSSAGLRTRKTPLPVVIIHGSRGAVMRAIHATQVETEFRIFNDYLDNGIRDNSLDDDMTLEKFTPSGLYSYELTTWSHKNKVYIKRYMIETLGHAWSGGDNQYEFNDPHGPDATKIMLDFFKEHGLNK